MPKKTFLFAYDQEGRFVDKLVYAHPVSRTTRRNLGTFLAIHFNLHPKGSIKAITVRNKNDVITPENVKKELF
jgi:hypothetical protein